MLLPAELYYNKRSKQFTKRGTMAPPDAAGAVAYALGRLAHELNPALVYHSLSHTRDEVLPAVARLAPRAGIAQVDRALLRTAAAFHDLGFIVRREEHETVGVEIAYSVLPRFGFVPAQIARIATMIMATRVPQTPHDLPSAILADADLDMLGRRTFRQRNQQLRNELAVFGASYSDAIWYSEQAGFLRRHSYFTPAARALRDAGKARNLAYVEAQLARTTG